MLRFGVLVAVLAVASAVSLTGLRAGKDLQKGILGVRMKSPDKYGALPEVADVTKDSAASRAGLKAGDVITEIEGQPVVRMAQILGDKLEASEEAIEAWQAIEEIFGESDEGTRALASLYRGTRRWNDLA